ncbi:hypothetical protein DFH06DRAFT_1325203 [Mycena polygramma]|nr:hypothetical protein DFH06DRAFT_1325203 [Mycena polygramma]
MTSFPVTPGTGPNPVPAATSPAPDNAAALQHLSAAIASLSQASAHSTVTVGSAVAAAPDAAAPDAAAPAAAPAAVGFHSKGPWVAGNLYVVVPTGPMLPTAEDEITDGEAAPTWYCITKGTYIGLTVSNPLAVNAVSGVSSSGMKGYKSQALALAAFNELLGYRMVAVVPS